MQNKIDSYLSQNDWRVKENSNSTYSFSGLMQYLANTNIAEYTLNETYPKKIANAHRNCDIHIHDLGYGIIPYCCGWSLEDLIKEGINKVPGKASSNPAKHLSTLMIQMVNFLGCMQMEAAGAQAFNSVDTYLAPFIKTDNLDFKTIKQCIQQLVFNLNIPSRWGSQSPFTNFTFDIKCPDDLKNKKSIVGGIEQDFTYGDCQEEMDMINIAFMEVMEEGDADGNIHSFPIPTYNITSNFDWDSKVTNTLCAMTAKYGIPYFANYVNSDMEPSDTRSMCCRLKLDLRELRKKNGGFFGAGDLTGSIGVVTINMPKIGYIAKNKNDYFKKLDRMLLLAKESLDIKRDKCNQMLNSGVLPYMKRYLNNGFNNHFSTIGIVGMNESCLNFLGVNIGSSEGNTFANEILDFINGRLADFQEQNTILYNLEATPAEGTSYRLAKHDKEDFPDIITAGTLDIPYYTNSVHLPVGYSNDISEILNLEDEMQTKFTSGTVIHFFVGEEIESVDIVKQIVNKVCNNYKLPHFSITPTFSTCMNHGYIKGEKYVCPICSSPTLVWSRIVGYYRPIQHWNVGKQQEFKEREYYKMEE